MHIATSDNLLSGLLGATPWFTPG